MARIRRKYLDEIIGVMDTEDIKVITGVRRSGKSILLDDFKKYIKKNLPDANIIDVNYSLVKFEKLREYHALNDYVEERYADGKKNFLLIDEVQMCDGYETVLNSFHASHKYDIYITGSNAFLSGSDLATLFVGRTYTIEVYPFSFAEFMEYYGYKDRFDGLQKYVKEGGMSGSYDYDTLKKKYDYISGIYDTLIVRDIEEKHGVKNTAVMNGLSDFLMDNISKLTSIRNVANALTSSHLEATDKTIGSYVKYLCEAYAFYRVRRYDIKGKRYLASTDKYYLSDHAFKYAKLGTKTPDYGDVYENIVAIELLRRGYEVYVGALRNSEVDFIAKRGDEKVYIQVSYSIKDEKTMKREVAPLMNLPGGYPRILIAGTEHPEYLYEGIRVVDIADWLLDDQEAA